MIALLTGPAGKWIIYGVIALFLAIGGTTGILMWKYKIKQEATAQFNNQQLKQALKENETFRQQLEELNAKSAQAVRDLEVKNSILETQNATIMQWLDSEEGRKGDREASELLKETIRRMSK